MMILLAAKTVVKYSVNKKKEIKINMKIEREEGRDEFIILFLWCEKEEDTAEEQNQFKF